jgi:pyrimidine-nucleoside phosphorylase
MLAKRAGDPVRRGEPLAVLYVGSSSNIAQAETILRDAIHIGARPPAPRPLVFGRVSSDGVERTGPEHSLIEAGSSVRIETR